MFNIDKSIKKLIGTPRRRGGKRDWDGDGVLNRKDCQPRNTMRQDRWRIGLKVRNNNTNKIGKIIKIESGSAPSGQDNTWLKVQHPDGKISEGLGWYNFDIV